MRLLAFALAIACGAGCGGSRGGTLASATADGPPPADAPSDGPAPDAVTADAAAFDGPGSESAPSVSAPDAHGPDSAPPVPACVPMVIPGGACTPNQSVPRCSQRGFHCQCDCGPTCAWSCDFHEWDAFFTIDPPSVAIDCTRPERVVEVKARIRLRGLPEGALSMELGRFSLELGVELGLERSCVLTGAVMPALAGPVAPGTSHGFTASARGTCQPGATLADPCDACGRAARAVLGLRVKDDALVAPWTSRGAGIQPHGTEITAVCTGRP